MYRIELYGIGYKESKELKSIVGVCYITKIKKDIRLRENRMMQLLEKGRLLDIIDITNGIRLDGDADIISSTLKTAFSPNTTVFAVHMCKTFSEYLKDLFVKNVKKFAVLILYLKEA